MIAASVDFVASAACITVRVVVEVTDGFFDRQVLSTLLSDVLAVIDSSLIVCAPLTSAVAFAAISLTHHLVALTIGGNTLPDRVAARLVISEFLLIDGTATKKVEE